MRLIAQDLAGERGGEPVFSGLSFTLDQRGALLVTGPNGAGKSTLLRIVVGLLPAAAGSVRLEASGGASAARLVPTKAGAGRHGAVPAPAEGSAQLQAEDTALMEAEGDHPSIASASHYLGHRDAMKPALSVIENLRFWRDLLGGNGLSILEALDSVGLSAIGGAPFAYLSAGQKRRAAIARLLLSPRPIWLLDEPTAGLDAAAEARLAELMRAHRSSGGIIIAATHQPLGLDDAQELNLAAASPSPSQAPTSPFWGGSLREAERGGGSAE